MNNSNLYKISSIIEQKYMCIKLKHDFSKIFFFYVTRPIKLAV